MGCAWPLRPVGDPEGRSSAVGAAGSQLRLLSISFFGSSALGLLLLVLAARWLTPADYGHFQAVWGMMFAFAGVLAALEQEVTRRATSASLDGRRTPVGVVQDVGLAFLACVVLLGVLVLTPLGREIVQGSVTIVALTLFSMINVVGLVLAHGVLLGNHALRAYAGLLIGEGLLRMVVLLFLLLLGVDAAVEWAVVATATGSLVWVFALRRLVRAVDFVGPRDPWRTVAGTVAALATANGLSALVLTGFPTVAAATLGNPGELAVLFAVITLARAPLALMAPVHAMIVPTVVRWSRNGDSRRLASALRHIAFGSAGTAALGGVLGYVAGPWVVALVLGSDYRPTPVMAALVAAATCVMAGALLQAATLVALGRHWQLTACWAAAIGSAAVVMLATPWDPEQRGLGGFTTASMVAFVATALTVRRTIGRTGAREERSSY